jgi:hypothetical protein
MPTRNQSLQVVLETLTTVGVIPGAAGWLAARAADIGKELQATIEVEIPAFAASGNPDIVRRSRKTHLGWHLLECRR